MNISLATFIIYAFQLVFQLSDWCMPVGPLEAASGPDLACGQEYPGSTHYDRSLCGGCSIKKVQAVIPHHPPDTWKWVQGCKSISTESGVLWIKGTLYNLCVLCFPQVKKIGEKNLPKDVWGWKKTCQVVPALPFSEIKGITICFYKKV